MVHLPHPPPLRESETVPSIPDERLLKPRVATALLGVDGRVLASFVPSPPRGPDPIAIHLRRRRDRRFDEALRSGAPYRERRAVATPVRTMVVEVEGTPLLDRDGDVVAVVERITDLARSPDDAALHRTRRVVESLAHDVNNPLAAIQGAVEVLRLDPRLGASNELNAISCQVERIEDAVVRVRHELVDEPT